MLIWSCVCSLCLVSVHNLGSFIRSGRKVEKKTNNKTRHVITRCMWDHLNEEKVRKLWTRRRREDFTVTFNEDPTEAGNSPWQSGHSCQASGRRRRVLGTTGDLYSGSPSRIYNHSWNGLIVRDGTSLSISSASHPRLLCAEIAFRSFVVTFYSSIGDPKFNFPLCSKTAVVNTQGPRNLIIMEGKAFFFFFFEYSSTENYK